MHTPAKGSDNGMISYFVRNSILLFAWGFALLAISCKENATEPSHESTATIEPNNTQQIIRGFGAANIVPWRPDMTSDEITSAFGTGADQIGFSILRLRVPYDQSEFSLNVPTAQSAAAMGVTLIASPWTPPAWMKTSDTIVGGSLYDTCFASYAAHLKSFADYMANNGAPLYAISVQNEPDVRVTYESCDWTAAQMVKFARENAPSVGVRIILPESATFNHSISDAVLNDPAAAASVSIIGGHVYNTSPASYPLATNQGKELWMTEYLDLDTSWAHNLGTGKQINDCMNTGMNAYLWWYIVRFYGTIREDGTVSKRGYVMSQYARFIRPGFFKINATANPQAGVYVTAYKNDSKIVIVAVNMNSSLISQEFAIQNGTATTYTPYMTSGTKNCVQGSDAAVSSGGFTATLDPSSIATFVSN
jgi:glucuronoarabinoxylan endo-1,4-beta-xylanase